MLEYRVQFRDNSGWRTCLTMSASTSNQRILMEMENAADCYPGCDIRVVDENGNIIDFLPA